MRHLQQSRQGCLRLCIGYVVHLSHLQWSLLLTQLSVNVIKAIPLALKRKGPEFGIKLEFGGGEEILCR